MMPFDVIFLAKKYIHHIPNMIQYEKLLEDIEGRSGENFTPQTGSRQVGEYIKKGTIIQKMTVEEFFSRFMSTRDILTFDDFSKACNSLGMVPFVCD